MWFITYHPIIYERHTARTSRPKKNIMIYDHPWQRTDHYGRYIIKRKGFSTGILQLMNFSRIFHIFSLFIHKMMRLMNFTNFLKTSYVFFFFSWFTFSLFVWGDEESTLLQVQILLQNTIYAWRTAHDSWVSQHRNCGRKRGDSNPIHGHYGEATYLLCVLKIGLVAAQLWCFYVLVDREEKSKWAGEKRWRCLCLCLCYGAV